MTEDDRRWRRWLDEHVPRDWAADHPEPLDRIITAGGPDELAAIAAALGRKGAAA